MQAYSNPKRESDPHSLPDVEVFQLTAHEVAAMDEDLIHEYMKDPQFRLAAMNSRDRNRMLDAIVADEGIEGGWYWWACMPGCLPDSEPNGPFDSAKEALADAQSEAADDDDDDDE